MTRFLNLLSISAVLLVTACGSNLKELSSQEKERLQGTLATLGNSTKAIAAVGKKQSGSSTSANKIFETLGSNGASTRNSEEMARRLEAAVNSKECEIVNKIPKSLTSSKNMKMEDARFIVKGVTCPVSLDLTVSANGSDNDGSAKFKLKYEVKETQFRELAQIDKVELEGTLNYNMKIPTDASSDFAMKFDADIRGNLHSLEEGDFKTYIKGNMNMSGNAKSNNTRGGMEFALGVEFKEFTGELKTVATLDSSSGKAESKNYLNNKEITDDEMKEWLSTVGLPVPAVNGPSSN